MRALRSRPGLTPSTGNITPGEREELSRLAKMIGPEKFMEVQNRVYAEHFAKHWPQMTAPYFPGLLPALLCALRDMVQH